MRPSVMGAVNRLMAAYLLVAAPVSAAEEAVEAQHGMIRIPATTAVVGTSPEEREGLAKKFGCDPSWLNGDLEKQEVNLSAFWIDRHPVTNRQYLAFVRAKTARPPWPAGVFLFSALSSRGGLSACRERARRRDVRT